jgi:alanine dehydrogenase
VTILGTGTVGTSAATVATGMGAHVTIIGRNLAQLAHIDEAFRGAVRTVYSTPLNIADCIAASDLLIGAVASTGAKAAKLITRDMLRHMTPGSVFVDVSIDQGGCAETSHVTTHADPVYHEEGVIHYCVANIPGAVPHTSTLALTNATLPYVLAVANSRVSDGLARDQALRAGVNTFDGHLTNEAVASAFGLRYESLAALL